MLDHPTPQHDDLTVRQALAAVGIRLVPDDEAALQAGYGSLSRQLSLLAGIHATAGQDETPWLDASIADTATALRAGLVSSEALTRAHLTRARRLHASLHAFVTLDEDGALDSARAADRAFLAGQDAGPLQGIPYGVKDLIHVRGLPTTCCSAWFADSEPAQEDALLVQRLRSAGAVVMGKQTTHEFGFGGPSFDLPFPVARNPWNPAHYAGGSSSGSAVAVAAGLGYFALGSDAGGSILCPAALCGVVGLKPTRGLLPTQGGWSSSRTLGHAGVMARRVADVAWVLDTATRAGSVYPRTGPSPAVSCIDGLEHGVRSMRIAIPANFLAASHAAHPEVLAGVQRAADALADAGAHIETITLPPFEQFAACARVIICAEAYAVHAAYLRQAPERYGALTRQNILLGATISADHYAQALSLRRHLATRMLDALHPFDGLLALGVHGPAPLIDAVQEMPWLARQQHVPYNLTGMPALSLPVGCVEGLPASVLVAGAPWHDATVLRIARALEHLIGWDPKRVPVDPD